MRLIIGFLCFLLFPCLAVSETIKRREDRNTITKLLDTNLENFDMEFPLVLNNSIIFAYYGKAKSVSIAGSFDNWLTESSMVESRENFWVFAIAKRLAAGKYFYRFKVDGLWIQDPLNKEFEYDAGFVKLSILNLEEEFIPNKKFPFWLSENLYRFQHRAKNAESVYIVGDFNNWNPFSHPMSYVGNELFEIDLELKSDNIYMYAFIEDGIYKADGNNKHQFRNAQNQPVNLFYANEEFLKN